MYVWVVLLLALTTHAHAQQTIDLAPFQVAEGWYRINGGLDISPADFLRDYAPVWGLTPQDEVRLHKTETDDLGYTHYRYRQFKNGYAVEHTDFFLHYKDSLLVEANANVVPNLNVTTNASISEATALSNALAYLNVREYAWQNADMTAQLREDTEDSTATYYPVGELVLARLANEELNARGFKFAYRFDVLSLKPYKHDYVYVDANTGEVIQKTSLIRTFSEDRGSEYDYTPPAFESKKLRLNKCDVNATCTTLYNGHQNITTIKRLFDYKLEECDRNINTLWLYVNGFNGTEITDDNGDWGTDDQDGTSAHWAAEKAHDYFRGAFGRKGSDGNGRQLRVFVGLDSANTNYSYISGTTFGHPRDIIIVGKELKLNLPYINTGKSHATLEIIGHEYTHAIIGNTSQLKGSNESGALAESFSDIFGTMIERYGQNGYFDWVAGAEVGNIRRSFENPTLYGHSSSYQDSSWINPANYASIHANCGVQNRWFYLLAVGDAQNGITVQSIGIDKAAAIAYRNMTTKLQQNSNYAQARTGAIQSAIELYGECSVEVAQVRNAWAAAGVGTPNNLVCLSIVGDNFVCRNNFTQATYQAVTNVQPVVWTLNIPNTHYSINGQYLTIHSLPTNVSTITITVTAGTGSVTYVVNVFGGVRCYMLQRPSASVEPIENVTEIRLYPNPAQGTFTLDLGMENAENAYVAILNTQGKQVGTARLAHRSNDIRISHLPAGLYFLHISVGNERKVLKLIVK
jgi:Zn-dependent metalloprotease